MINSILLLLLKKQRQQHAMILLLLLLLLLYITKRTKRKQRQQHAMILLLLFYYHYYWTYVSSTQMLNHFKITPLRPASDDMSRRKGVSMTNTLGRSNMPPSPHSSSQHQEGWASRRQRLTSDIFLYIV